MPSSKAAIPGGNRHGATSWTERRVAVSTQYEEVAANLFAARGFHNVTVAEVAEAAGVTSRTLFRYFPTKEDMLLAGPRRVTGLLVDAISAVDPDEEPVQAVWDVLISMTNRYGAPLKQINLWYRAAADAPDVITRVHGERAATIEAALTTVFAMWMQVNPQTDVRPRVLAAAMQASERAVLEHYRARRGRDNLAQLFEVASSAVTGLAATLLAGGLQLHPAGI